MALIEVLLPKMGESVMEATINTWLKKVGDAVEEDESLLEVSTDKVDTEVPSTHGGIVKELLAQEGDVVQVGKPIAIISTDSSDEDPVGSDVQQKTSEKAAAKKEQVRVESGVGNGKSNGFFARSDTRQKSDRFYSPLVKNIAREENISIEELDKIAGSGKDNRVTKKDILDYISQKSKKPVAVTAAYSGEKSALKFNADLVVSADDEVIEMDRMRKIIAERMVESRRISAHVQSFIEADVTNVVRWREKIKEDFEKVTGEKLTYTPIFIEAIVSAIKEFPMINISVKEDKIIRHKHVNIGMAVALPTGNLIVPVIRNADQLSLAGLARKVNDLANRARNNELLPDELTGGTYTVTNVGSFGSVMGTPIIVQPQVAIMALGAIVKKPAVIETEAGDMIAIRHKMFLSHSYDHRVIDGMLGSLFAKKVTDYLEGFDVNRKV